ncbi:MAG TPA: ATP-binding cassette domain-containing protein [Dehalococcoidales bacterium]|nr:ATP-binding cassette domain-containing protein [Dehalococcoidales bacterium]
MSNQQVAHIEAKGLNVGYGNEVVVADINFALSPGEAFALIGTNGSGKSTLLKTIVGLQPPSGGHLSVFGRPPGNNHRRIAYLGQFHHHGFVLPIRAVDVVRMGRFPLHGLFQPMGPHDEEIVQAAMRTMGVDKLADMPLRSMSGGQQQRTYLAQVLAHQADLLVLDEPSTGLDAGGRELYLHAINDELCRGASVIMATHDIQDEAALCHQVMLLARKVVAVGAPGVVMTPEALLETFGIVVTGEQKMHVLECRHGHDVEGIPDPDQKLH